MTNWCILVWDTLFDYYTLFLVPVSPPHPSPQSEIVESVSTAFQHNSQWARWAKLLCLFRSTIPNLQSTVCHMQLCPKKYRQCAPWKFYGARHDDTGIKRHGQTWSFDLDPKGRGRGRQESWACWIRFKALSNDPVLCVTHAVSWEKGDAGPRETGMPLFLHEYRAQKPILNGTSKSLRQIDI